METHDDMRREVAQTQRILNEVMDGKDRGLVERVSALVTAYNAERERGEILKTKLAMRIQQLREADAHETAWRKAYVDTFDWFSHMLRDVLGGEYVHGDGASVDDARERGRALAAGFAERLRARLREADTNVAQLRTDLARMRESMSEDAVDWRDLYNETKAKLDQTPVDTSPEPWEGIVTAAIRWRKDMDRGELAREVDSFLGANGVELANVLEMPNTHGISKASDLKGLAARESVAAWQPSYLPYLPDRTSVLRPEQYADGAGALAWRQAMGGKL